MSSSGCWRWRPPPPRWRREGDGVLFLLLPSRCATTCPVGRLACMPLPAALIRSRVTCTEPPLCAAAARPPAAATQVGRPACKTRPIRWPGGPGCSMHACKHSGSQARDGVREEGGPSGTLSHPLAACRHSTPPKLCAISLALPSASLQPNHTEMATVRKPAPARVPPTAPKKVGRLGVGCVRMAAPSGPRASPPLAPFPRLNLDYRLHQGGHGSAGRGDFSHVSPG